MAATEANLDVITWNLHGLPYFWDKHYLRMARALNAAVLRKPDAILFQEVWGAGDAARLAAEADKSGYVAVGGPKGFGRSCGGLMTLLSQRWRVHGSPMFTRYDVHASALKVYEADGIGHKGVLHLTIRDLPGITALALLNTHLQSQYGAGRAYKAIRAAQLRQLVGLVTKIEPQLPMVIGGDFNTTPDEDDILYAVRAACEDLTQPFRLRCKNEPACGTCFVSHDKLEWIDYVWARRSSTYRITGDLILIKNRSSDNPYSDHQGVDCSVNIRDDSLANTIAWLGKAINNPELLTRRAMLATLGSTSRNPRPPAIAL